MTEQEQVINFSEKQFLKVYFKTIYYSSEHTYLLLGIKLHWKEKI